MYNVQTVHSSISLKGQSNEIFDPQFFSSFEPAWPTDQWVKIVLFLVSFSLRYSYFFEVPRSIILRRVKFRAVSYCEESSSAQYHTAQSQSLKFVVKAPRSIILPGVKFRAVSNCAESSSTQYHTARSQCTVGGFSQVLLQSALN